MLRTSFNAQMISGRRRLRSSAALQVWQTKTIDEYEVRLSLQADQLLDELQVMAPKSITSPASAPAPQMTLGTLWSVATASSRDLENALQMFCEECSGPH
jgi:hypothetical protein